MSAPDGGQPTASQRHDARQASDFARRLLLARFTEGGGSAGAESAARLAASEVQALLPGVPLEQQRRVVTRLLALAGLTMVTTMTAHAMAQDDHAAGDPDSMHSTHDGFGFDPALIIATAAELSELTDEHY